MKRIYVVLSLACIPHIIASSQESHETRGSQQSDNRTPPPIQISIPFNSYNTGFEPFENDKDRNDMLIRAAAILAQAQHHLAQATKTLSSALASLIEQRSSSKTSSRRKRSQHQDPHRPLGNFNQFSPPTGAPPQFLHHQPAYVHAPHPQAAFRAQRGLPKQYPNATNGLPHRERHQRHPYLPQDQGQ